LKASRTSTSAIVKRKAQLKKIAAKKVSAKAPAKKTAAQKAADKKAAVQRAQAAKSAGGVKNIAALIMARKAKTKNKKRKVKIGSRKMARSEHVHEEGRPAKLPEVLNSVKLNSYIRKMMAEKQIASGVALNAQSAKSMDALMKLLMHRFTDHASQSMMGTSRKTLTDKSIQRTIKKLLPGAKLRALRTRMLEEGQKAVETFKKERKQKRLERARLRKAQAKLSKA